IPSVPPGQGIPFRTFSRTLVRMCGRLNNPWRFVLICAGALLAGGWPGALGQTAPVTVDASSQMWCRVLMAGSAGPWTPAALDLSLDIASPTPGSAGPVTVHDLRIRIPITSCPIAIPPSLSLSPTITNLVASAGAGTGFTAPGSAGAGQTFFSAG